MTTTPSWSPVDDATADLLSLVADLEHPSVDFEWETYRDALRSAADASGVVDPNRLRSLVRGHIAPRRIGAFMNKALAAGLVEYTGRWVESTDTAGRNAGKPCRELRLVRS